MEKRMYKIDELAKVTGVTIRTLRYYDKIGLLKPAEVSEAGYRLYTKENVLKLQYIMV
jgi:DNA-binding transcriptional MerR regulator